MTRRPVCCRRATFVVVDEAQPAPLLDASEWGYESTLRVHTSWYESRRTVSSRWGSSRSCAACSGRCVTIHDLFYYNYMIHSNPPARPGAARPADAALLRNLPPRPRGILISNNYTNEYSLTY